MSPWKHFTIISCPLFSQLDDLNTISERQLFPEYCTVYWVHKNSDCRKHWPLQRIPENRFRSSLLAYKGSSFSQGVPSSRNKSEQSVTDLERKVTIRAHPPILLLRKPRPREVKFLVNSSPGAELQLTVSNPDSQPQALVPAPWGLLDVGLLDIEIQFISPDVGPEKLPYS